MATVFDHVRDLIEQIGMQKRAASGIEDPGGMDGATTHPSKKTDDNLKPATEGAQSADNERTVKETVPDVVDTKPDATPGNVPKDPELQITDAKPTGEDPSAEDAYKSKPAPEKREGEQGGTEHPAVRDLGEKYSADRVAAMDDEALLKAAMDLGNELAADMITRQTTASPKQAVDANAAAAAGAATADAADELTKMASDVIQEVVASAYHNADLVTWAVQQQTEMFKRAAEEEVPMDPNAPPPDEGGGGEPGGAPGGEELPPEALEALMAAMAGGQGAGDAGGAPGIEDAAGAAGGEAPPDEMGGMNDEQALQELAMALQEAGINPEELANDQAGPEGAKIAAAVTDFRRSGRFRFTEAKQGSAERKTRDYMKGYCLELYERSKR